MTAPKAADATFEAIVGFVTRDAAGRPRLIREGAIVGATDPILASPYGRKHFVPVGASDAERGAVHATLLAEKHAANPRRHVPDKSWRAQEEPPRWPRPHLPDRLFNSPKRVRRETPPTEEQSA